VVVRTTDNMLRLVPNSLLEAAFALGAPRWKVAMLVRLRAVKAGVVTGVLLAVARISGETAPLLFTALNNQFFSADMNAADGQPAGGDLPLRHEPLRQTGASWPGAARCW
jgi:phosphate transport system permease protein